MDRALDDLFCLNHHFEDSFSWTNFKKTNNAAGRSASICKAQWQYWKSDANSELYKFTSTSYSKIVMNFKIYFFLICGMVNCTLQNEIWYIVSLFLSDVRICGLKSFFIRAQALGNQSSYSVCGNMLRLWCLM